MLIANVGLVTERTLGEDNFPTKDPSLGAPKRRNLRSEVRGGVHERPELVDLLRCGPGFCEAGGRVPRTGSTSAV